MFSKSRHSKNLPNKSEGEKKEKPFFPKSSKKNIQTKTDDAFFQPKSILDQSGDKHENGVESIQRTTLATPQEDEKLATAEQRMEEDKLIQEKTKE